MKCEFCNSEMKAGEIICGVCGFTHINFTEADDRGVKAQMKRSFAQQKLGSISLEIKVYDYTIERGNITENEVSVKAANASELVLNEIKWLDTEFYGTSDKLTTEIEFCIKKDDDVKSFNLPMELPAAEKLRIGVLLDDGLKVKLAVGDKNNYVLSESMSLI